jgi:hypothetical protein
MRLPLLPPAGLAEGKIATAVLELRFPTFNHEGGTTTFTPSSDGTHVDWVSTYTHPATPIRPGRAAG